MPPVLDVTTTNAVFGAVSAIVTLFISKWIDGSAADRRLAAEQRRESDREARQALRDREAECNHLRERLARVEAENAVLRALPASRGTLLLNLGDPE